MEKTKKKKNRWERTSTDVYWLLFWGMVAFGLTIGIGSFILF